MEFVVSWTLLIYVALFGAIIYFLMIRPSQKRSNDQKQMMNAMQPGARVMLTSGLFGTVQAIGDQQMVVELAPGMAVTVVKQAVARVLSESEEEFEYADDEHEQIEGEQAETAAIEPDGDADKPAEAPDFEPADDGALKAASESANDGLQAASKAADEAFKAASSAEKKTKN